MSGVNFTPGAAAKIQTAVKRVLGDAEDQRSSPVPGGNGYSRVFWATQQDTTQSFVEVYQTSESGTLTWTTLPGGRYGTLSNLKPGYSGSNPSHEMQSVPCPTGVFLVYQHFDGATGNPYYSAIGDNNTIVQVTGQAEYPGVYEGNIIFGYPGWGTISGGGYSASDPHLDPEVQQACWIINLEEVSAPIGHVGWALSTAEGHYCLGSIVGVDTTGQPVVAINNGNIGTNEGGATTLTATDQWNIASGLNGSGTPQSITIVVPSTITVSPTGTVTNVATRNWVFDARGRLMGISSEGG